MKEDSALANDGKQVFSLAPQIFTGESWDEEGYIKGVEGLDYLIRRKQWEIVFEGGVPLVEPFPVDARGTVHQAAVFLHVGDVVSLAYIIKLAWVGVEVAAWWEDEVVLSGDGGLVVVPPDHIRREMEKLGRQGPQEWLTDLAVRHLLCAVLDASVHPIFSGVLHKVDVITITDYERHVSLIRVKCCSYSGILLLS